MAENIMQNAQLQPLKAKDYDRLILQFRFGKRGGHRIYEEGTASITQQEQRGHLY